MWNTIFEKLNRKMIQVILINSVVKILNDTLYIYLVLNFHYLIAYIYALPNFLWVNIVRSILMSVEAYKFF